MQGPVRPAVWNGQRKRKAEVNEKKAEKADADRQRKEKRIAKKAKMAEDEAEKARRENIKSELGRGILHVPRSWESVDMDPSGQAARYLRYQRGAFLVGSIPSAVLPDNLRKSLVATLAAGSNMTLTFSTL